MLLPAIRTLIDCTEFKNASFAQCLSFMWNNILFQLAAVAVNPELLYAVVEVQPVLEDTSKTGKQINLGRILTNGERKPFIIVASALISTLESKWGVKLLIRKTFPGSALENCRLEHELKNNERTSMPSLFVFYHILYREMF